MKTSGVVLALALAVSGAVFAQDDVIAAANAEMDRLEKLITSVSKGDSAKYNEVGDALNDLSRKFSKAQRTPALSTANTRSKDLRARLAAAYAGTAAPPPTSGAGSPVSTTERGALQRLTSEAGMAQQILDQNPPEKFTVAHGDFVREKIKRCEAELPRCPPASHPDTAAAMAKLDKLKVDLEMRVGEAGKLAPGAKKVTASIQEWVARLAKQRTEEPLAFNDADGRVPKRLREDLDDIERALGKAGNQEHPDAKEAAAALADARKKFDGAIAEAKAAITALGDWKAELVRMAATCEGRAQIGYHYDTEAQMKEWISSLGPIKANIDAIGAYILKLEATIPAFNQGTEYRAIADKLFEEKNTFNQNTTYWENEFVKDINMADTQSVDHFDQSALELGHDGFGVVRRPLQEGREAAKMQAFFYSEFKKSPADAAASEAKVKEIEAKLVKLEAAQEKLIDVVRMMKDTGTPALRTIAANVTKGGPFTKWLKGDGSKLLRVVVIDQAVVKTNSWEWSGNKLYHRDYDYFEGVVALKSPKGGVEMFRVEFRFSRMDWPQVPKNAWNFFQGSSYGPIREANVFK